jgi:ribosome maturation factor RimP
MLEVSSPGLERPLRWHRHWVRFVGRDVTAKLEGLGRVRARIVGVPDEQTVELAPEGAEPRRIPIAAIRDARLAADLVADG